MSNKISNIQSEDILIEIKFRGPDLKYKSIPIYEVGQTFVAFQTIIHKAFLFENGRIKKGAQLTSDERRKLALRINQQRIGSDIYELIPFLSDPVISSILGSVIVRAFQALGEYTFRRIRNKKKDRESNQILIGAIYNQVNVIADRIGNIGGINNIEISDQTLPGMQPIIINKDVRDYIRELGAVPLEGDVTQIEGVVVRLYTRESSVLIQNIAGEYTKVKLRSQDFDRVRYQADEDSVVKFEGKHVYWLGKETSKFSYFQADRILAI